MSYFGNAVTLRGANFEFAVGAVSIQTDSGTMRVVDYDRGYTTTLNIAEGTVADIEAPNDHGSRINLAGLRSGDSILQEVLDYVIVTAAGTAGSDGMASSVSTYLTSHGFAGDAAQALGITIGGTAYVYVASTSGDGPSVYRADGNSLSLRGGVLARAFACSSWLSHVPLLSGYDEPRTLSYQITLFGPIGADVRQQHHFGAQVRRTAIVDESILAGDTDHALAILRFYNEPQVRGEFEIFF